VTNIATYPMCVLSHMNVSCSSRIRNSYTYIHTIIIPLSPKYDSDREILRTAMLLVACHSQGRVPSYHIRRERLVVLRNSLKDSKKMQLFYKVCVF
jgi:hypothetical protein